MIQPPSSLFITRCDSWVLHSTGAPFFFSPPFPEVDDAPRRFSSLRVPRREGSTFRSSIVGHDPLFFLTRLVPGLLPSSPPDGGIELPIRLPRNRTYVYCLFSFPPSFPETRRRSTSSPFFFFPLFGHQTSSKISLERIPAVHRDARPPFFPFFSTDFPLQPIEKVRTCILFPFLSRISVPARLSPSQANQFQGICPTGLLPPFLPPVNARPTVPSSGDAARFAPPRGRFFFFFFLYDTKGEGSAPAGGLPDCQLRPSFFFSFIGWARSQPS